MSTQDEWGPWIDHDGRGCPVVGQFVHRVYNAPARDVQDGVIKDEKIGVIKEKSRHPCWSGVKGYAQVVRYRVRKPRALIELRRMVENLPAPAKPKVPA